MNPVLYGWLAGVSTLVSMLAFVGVIVWCYSGRRRTEYDQAARLPLEEDGDACAGGL
jgi:cytochrome c oxidase cbb3-type subunit 4